MNRVGVLFNVVGEERTCNQARPDMQRSQRPRHSGEPDLVAPRAWKLPQWRMSDCFCNTHKPSDVAQSMPPSSFIVRISSYTTIHMGESGSDGRLLHCPGHVPGMCNCRCANPQPGQCRPDLERFWNSCMRILRLQEKLVACKVSRQAEQCQEQGPKIGD